MLIGFFALASSYFVSHFYTNADYLQHIKYDSIESLKSPKTIILCIYSHKIKSVHLHYQSFFAKLASFFGEDCDFEVVSLKSSEKFFLNYNITNNRVLFVQNGQIVYSIPPPTLSSEKEILEFIDWFVYPENYNLMTSKQKLIYCCGLTHLTFITLPSNATKLKPLMKKYINDTGLAIIITAPRNLMESLQLDPAHHYVHLIDDNYLNPFDTNEQFAKNASKPKYYYKFVPESIQYSNNTFCIIKADPSFEKTIKALAYRFGSSFTFALGDHSLYPLFEEAILNPVPRNETTLCIAFNPKGKYFYQPFHYFFGQNVTKKRISYYLEDILEGNLGKTYHSESYPEEDVNKVFKKLVGYNYKDFMLKNTTKLVVYIRSEFTIAQNLIFGIDRYFDYLNITNIELGYIDIVRNSSPFEFPEQFMDPHIHLYPVGDSKGISFFGSRTVSAVMRFLVENNVVDDVQDYDMPIDKDTEIPHLIDVLYKYETTPQEYHDQLRKYIMDIAPKLAFGSYFDEIVENILDYTIEETEERHLFSREQLNLKEHQSFTNQDSKTRQTKEQPVRVLEL